MISLGRLKLATNTESVTRFVTEVVLPGTGWNLVKVRRRSVRLEPPYAYWATYRVTVGRGERVPPEPSPAPEYPDSNEATAFDTSAPTEAATVAPEPVEVEEHWTEERDLRLAARGFFDPAQWAAYRDNLVVAYAGAPCRPLDGQGAPAIFDDSQVVFWFFPVDPAMPALPRAADPAAMAALLRAQPHGVLDQPARIESVEIEVARYVPEISAILEYRIAATPAEAGKRVFGKVQPGDRGAMTHRVMSGLWAASQQSQGRLRIPRPIGWYPDLGLYIQDAAAGEPLGSDRLAPEFLPAVVHAAEALAEIHESGIPTTQVLPLSVEVARLDRTLDQFAMTNPDGYFLLREFLAHLKDRIKRTPEEEWLPTHGDFKHDQILHEDGQFSVIDFDFFGSAETSFDLGKFAAYLVPGMPKSWEHSVAADEARQAFLRRYLELRPGATLQRFPIYESCNLAGRAMTLMWTQMFGWQKASQSLLVLALERLKARVPAA